VEQSSRFGPRHCGQSAAEAAPIQKKVNRLANGRDANDKGGITAFAGWRAWQNQSREKETSKSKIQIHFKLQNPNLQMHEGRVALKH
jgi:hypothetical protein